MRIAPEGWPFIILAWALVAILAAVHWIIPAVILVPVAIWVVAFFRDPIRDRVRGAELILAPADGKIVSIITMDEPAFLNGPSTRVAIFMNVLSVHVNRYPADGTIEYRHYGPGTFLHAASDKASTDNEQSTVGLATSKGRILVRQIAGSIARRIVTDHQTGRTVKQGERLGLIRFGSRVDLFLPPNADVAVKVGDLTTAGDMVMARWK